MKTNNTRSKWHKMAVLKYDVRGPDGTVLLPTGTPNVSIAFRCGCFRYLNEAGDWVWANKYRDAMGRIYYGH